MEELQPYIERKDGDLLKAEEWNEIQKRARQDITSHSHTGELDGTPVPSEGLAEGAVTTDRIAAGAVSGEKLADETVSEGKLQPAAVTRTRLSDDLQAAIDGAETAIENHNRLLHTPGVAEGLTVSISEDGTQVSIQPGTAVKRDGSEIVLSSQNSLDLSSFADKNVMVVITGDDAVSLIAEDSAVPKEAVHLAVVVVNSEGKGTDVNLSQRQRISARLSGGAQTPELLLTRAQVQPDRWPALFAGASERMDVRGSLKVEGTGQFSSSLEVQSDTTGDPALLGVSTPDGVDFLGLSSGSNPGKKAPYLVWRRERNLQFGTASTTGGQHFSAKMTITDAGNVGIGTTDPQSSLHVIGNLLGAAAGPDGPCRLAVGSTTPGKTSWSNYGENGLYVDINTSSHRFSETPYYFASIAGDSNHWRLTGTSSIYNMTAKWFRIYVYFPNAISPAQANKYRWHIHWLAVGI